MLKKNYKEEFDKRNVEFVNEKDNLQNKLQLLTKQHQEGIRYINERINSMEKK